jgi:RHS repeat-associated protein
MYSAEGIEKEIDYVRNVTWIRTAMPGDVGYTLEMISGTAVAANATSSPDDLYFMKDNLGSPEIVYDTNGPSIERMAYDAWGRRRNNSGSENAWTTVDQSSLANTQDHKGYTDQEELDELSLVHLNGRVYDPLTSRFVSPDPTIPDPYDLQSLNRASYVRNSPMEKVDPTGFDEIDTSGAAGATPGGDSAAAAGAADAAGKKGSDGTHGWDTIQVASAKQSDVEADTKETKQVSDGKNPTGTTSGDPNGGDKAPNGDPKKGARKSDGQPNDKPLAETKIKFFKAHYAEIAALAKKLNVSVDYLLALSAHESGWCGEHCQELHNLFGQTAHGGKNLNFGSYDQSLDLFGKDWGERLKGVTSSTDFDNRLQPPDHSYDWYNSWASKRDPIPGHSWRVLEDKIQAEMPGDLNKWQQSK